MLSDSTVFSSSESDNDVVRPYVVQCRRNISGPQICFAEARFRLNTEQLQTLCEMLQPELQHSGKQTLRKGFTLSVRQQVAIGLRALASGGTYRTIGDAHGVSVATVCTVVKRFVGATVKVLCPAYITIPGGDVLRESIEGFRAVAGMVNVWGCVDGTHVKVHPPQVGEDSYLNRHHFHSLNCQVVCTSSLFICSLSTRWGGRVHDSRVFRNSTIGMKLHAGWRPDNRDVVLLGDSAYRSSDYLKTPVSKAGGRVLSPQENAYNERHRRTRSIVERCIGVWKSQFRCLKDLRIRGPRSTGEQSMLLTSNTIRACAASRNFFIVNNIDREENVDSDISDGGVESDSEGVASEDESDCSL
ncbi:hypothetical protein FOL47_000734 [Perkinsus chesapeaki]|uniref:Putative nuclease HARBI1 n=1 Tax=Perkinsus chesapeaki TaxID=330153 RepID=A0A7J6KVP0_PERCH|nr:hypothetical protein FOL47_000734 [Perkinsus chesapeaki]